MKIGKTGKPLRTCNLAQNLNMNNNKQQEQNIVKLTERRIKERINQLLWPLVGMLTPGHEKFTCQVWQLFTDGGNLTLDNSFDIRFSTSIKLKKSVLTVFSSHSQPTRFFRFSVFYLSSNCHCHATFKNVTLS